jgi:hypothetical protein
MEKIMILVLILFCEFTLKNSQIIEHKATHTIWNSDPKCVSFYKKFADVKISDMENYHAILHRRIDSLLENNEGLEYIEQEGVRKYILPKYPFAKEERMELFGDLHKNPQILQFVATIYTQKITQSVVETKGINHYYKFDRGKVVYEKDIADSLFYQITEAFPTNEQLQNELGGKKLFYVFVDLKVGNIAFPGTPRENCILSFVFYCQEENTYP